MLEDLNMTGGLIYSPRVLLALVSKGAYRDTAYRWVQRNAMKRWLEGEDFYENLCKDEDVRKYLSEEEIKECFDYKPMLIHVDEIFARLDCKSGRRMSEDRGRMPEVGYQKTAMSR